MPAPLEGGLCWWVAGCAQRLNLSYGLQGLEDQSHTEGGEIQDAKTLYGALSALMEVRNSELAEDMNPSFWGRRWVGRTLPLGARRAVPFPPPPTPQGCGGGRWQGGWGLKMAAWRLWAVWLAARGSDGLWGKRGAGVGSQKEATP